VLAVLVEEARANCLCELAEVGQMGTTEASEKESPVLEQFGFDEFPVPLGPLDQIDIRHVRFDQQGE